MTRAERRRVARMRREARRLMRTPAATPGARHALDLLDRLEREDPRPSLRLRLRLRLAGVDVG